MNPFVLKRHFGSETYVVVLVNLGVSDRSILYAEVYMFLLLLFYSYPPPGFVHFFVHFSGIFLSSIHKNT